MVATPELQLAAPSEGIWSVSDVTGLAKRLIDDGMGPVWVRGEVVQCKAWASGHWYFTLRDPRSQVKCCMFRQEASRAGRIPAEGTEVYALATPSLWEEKGEFRLKIMRLIPTASIGRQQKELERAREALRRDGLLDPARKRRLPGFPTCIAVVTSVDGAALRDIAIVARRRWPLARILVIGARVQGDGAAAELVRALGVVNRCEGVDLCIVGRGGGGREDLAAFNDERVCRALAAVRVPTISAVGHETDISLTDLVADHRAATPSAAVETALPDRRDVARMVDELASRLANGLALRTSVAAERLERTADRLTGSIADILRARRHRADCLASELNALSPLRVLERGYALPRRDGRVLRQVADFEPGEAFELRVSDGSVRARAEGPA